MAAITEVISQTGQTLYCTIHDSTAKLANGASTEVYNGSNWTTYVNSLAEQGTTGYYFGAFPSYLPSGKYSIVFYQRAGGSAAITDPVIGSSQIYWNGTIEEQSLASVVAGTPVTLAGSQPAINIGSVSSVSTIGAAGLAAIQSQILALLNASTMPELTSAPGATPTIFQALMLLYMSLRNAHTATTTQEKIYNNAGAVVATGALSDDGSTFTKGQLS